jgi:hypothetical protein
MCKLPPLILFEEYENDWSKYVEAVYQIFCEDLKYSKLRYNNESVFLKRYPLYRGKEKAFWHFTSEGDVEEERIPSLRRCERIRCIRYIIENSGEEYVKEWRNKRKNREHICLALKSFEYIVVLGQRNGYCLLLSAYPIDYEWRRLKMCKEYEAYKKQNPLI